MLIHLLFSSQVKIKKKKKLWVVIHMNLYQIVIGALKKFIAKIH